LKSLTILKNYTEKERKGTILKSSLILKVMMNNKSIYRRVLLSELLEIAEARLITGKAGIG